VRLSTDPGTVPVPGRAGLRLHRWNDRAVVGVAVAAFASGFGQFGVVAALGELTLYRVMASAKLDSDRAK
jgi:hypothetical protein